LPSGKARRASPFAHKQKPYCHLKRRSALFKIKNCAAADVSDGLAAAA
jgi:hypothetical protein